MDIEDAIFKRRTIRRFKQEPISIDILKKLIDFARVAPAGSNLQSVEYIIVKDKEYREKVFSLIRWAGSLPRKERTPEIGRRPMVYIIVLVNTKIKKIMADLDVGAAIENILLGAVNFGIGSCWMGAIDVEKIRELFSIPEFYDIKNVISLGYPDETSIIEPYKDSFTYWKDQNGVMHIPKKDVKDLILDIY